MNNRTAKNKLEEIANSLDELLESEKWTEDETDEIYHVCLKLISLCSEDKKLKYKEKKSEEKRKKAEDKLINRCKEKIENLEKTCKKNKNEEEKEKIETDCKFYNAIIETIKLPENESIWELEKFFKRKNNLKIYFEEGKNPGAALSDILKKLDIKKKQLFEYSVEILNDCEKEHKTKIAKHYDGMEDSLEIDMNNLFYDNFKAPYEQDIHKELWKIMLEALKKCAEESGLIEINMPSDPEEYFTYLCKIYYCMECTEWLKKIGMLLESEKYINGDVKDICNGN